MEIMDLTACFDHFTATAFRLETRDAYDTPGEDYRLAAFRAGVPRPEQSVWGTLWLGRITESTAAGKQWSRVHIVSRPASEYVRYEIASYFEASAAGEDIRLASRDAMPALAELRTDFWLFDHETGYPFAALMRYDDSGHHLGTDVTDAPPVIARCIGQRALAVAAAQPLAEYAKQIPAA
jgi:hypothetical protein